MFTKKLKNLVSRNIKVVKSATILLAALFAGLTAGTNDAFSQDTTTVVWQHGPAFGKDASIENGTTTSTKNIGANNRIAIGSTTSSLSAPFVRRALIEFDSISTIPSSATIIDASLTLIVKTVDGGLIASDWAGVSAEVYMITSSWGEGDNTGFQTSSGVSWVGTSNPSLPWSTPGGDFSGLFASIPNMGSLTVGDSLVISGNLKNLIQLWVNGINPNYGILIKASNESAGNNQMHFASSDNEDPAAFPKLTVTYVTPPPDAPSGITATDGTLADHIKVTWNSVAEADSYKVYRSTSELSTSDFELIETVTDTTYNDTGAPIYTVNNPTTISATIDSLDKIIVTWSGESIIDGESRWYKVTAVTSGGSESGFSSLDSGFRDDTFPASPVQVDSAIASSGPFTTLAADQGSPFTHSGLPQGSSIWYRLRIKSTAGTLAATFSDIVNGQTEPEKGFIHVTLKSAQDSSLVQSAQIILTDIDTSSSDAQGTALFSNLPATGGYSLSISKALLSPKFVSDLTVPPADTLFKVVFLDSLPGAITGVVFDSLSGSFLSNVQVSVTPGNYTDITDALGNFTVTGIPPSAGYTVTLTRNQYADTVFSPVQVFLDSTLSLGTIEMAHNDSASIFIDIDFDDGVTTNNLQFGFHPTATNGIDTVLGESELPPLPISGAFFDVRFVGDDLGNGSLTDIRESDFDMLTYIIDLKRKSGSDTVTVTWDSIAAIGQEFTLVEFIGTGPVAGASVNMLNTTSHTITDTTVERLHILAGPTGFITWSINYPAGWNLVSLGGVSATNTLSSIFPTANSPASSFNTGTQSYQTTTTLDPGIGYWVDFPSVFTFAYVLEAIDSLSMSLSTGWNMIGTVSSSLALTDINDPSSAIISIYKNDVGLDYVLVTDSLRQGEGYWLNSASNATIELVETGLSKSFSGIYYLNTLTEDDRLFGLSVDTDYGNQLLNIYSGEGSREVNRSFSLPPTAPYQRTAVRFNLDDIRGMNGLYVTEGESLEGTITIKVPDDNRMLMLRWDNSNLKAGEYFLRDGVDGALFADVDMAEQTELSLSGLNINQVLFEYEGRAPVVEDYALEPNYPNPFNPETNINYRIKEAGLVKLTIYNILGQEVRSLVRSIQNAGSFSVKWDGRDNFGRSVAGGMYIYRLETKGFTASRKLLLIK